MASVSLECRRCGATIVVDDDEPLPKDFPFCTERCRLIDLGKWFDEDFKITREIRERDIETVD